MSELLSLFCVFQSKDNISKHQHADCRYRSHQFGLQFRTKQNKRKFTTFTSRRNFVKSNSAFVIGFLILGISFMVDDVRQHTADTLTFPSLA
jgi:hypothetical protein